MSLGAGLLALGGVLSAIAALLHIGCIAFGASWFRFFGAPERAVVAYENGDMRLVWMTVAITAVLAIWAVYAFSAAGLIGRLPLLRTGLVTIASIYLLRGLLLVPALAKASFPGSTFDIWSSTIVLVYGLIHAAGTWLAWERLSSPTQ